MNLKISVHNQLEINLKVWNILMNLIQLCLNCLFIGKKVVEHDFSFSANFFEFDSFLNHL